MVGFVHKNEVEEIGFEVVEPTIFLSRDLMNVGYGQVAIAQVVHIDSTARNNRCFGEFLARCQYAATFVEIGLAAAPQVVAKLAPDALPGAMTSTRRAVSANGAIAIKPDLPQPTGKTMPTSRAPPADA